jgi:hypothetical protein
MSCNGDCNQGRECDCVICEAEQGAPLWLTVGLWFGLMVVICFAVFGL